MILEPVLSKAIMDFIRGEYNDSMNILFGEYKIIEMGKKTISGKESLIHDLIKYINDKDFTKAYSILGKIENNDKSADITLESQNDYINKVKDLINIEKVDEMDALDYERFNNFKGNNKVITLKK